MTTRRSPGVQETNRTCQDLGQTVNNWVIVARHRPLDLVSGIGPFTIGCVGLSCSDVLPPALGGVSHPEKEQRCR